MVLVQSSHFQIPVLLLEMPFGEAKIMKNIFLMQFMQIIIAAVGISAHCADVFTYEALAKKMGYFDFNSVKSLTEAEKTALQKYKISTNFECIQQYLFTPESVEWAYCDLMTDRNPRAGDVTDIVNMIQELDSAFPKQARLPEGLLLFRGQGQPEFNRTVFTRSGYTSTSVDPNEALAFYKGAMLVIRIPKGGFPGLLMGAWEKEVLLPRNTSFVVIDTRIVKGQLRYLIEPCEGRCMPGLPYQDWEKF